jgi:hypothetical protein
VANPWLVLDQGLFGRRLLRVGGIKQRKADVAWWGGDVMGFRIGQPARSFLFAAIAGGLFELIEQSTDLIQFSGRRFATGQRVKDQFGSRPPKSPLDQIVNQLLLRLRPRDGGSIEVGTAADIPPHEPFIGHDLKQLQHCGVGHRTAFVNELFVHVAHRTRLALPKHPKDF